MPGTPNFPDENNPTPASYSEFEEAMLEWADFMEERHGWFDIDPMQNFDFMAHTPTHIDPQLDGQQHRQISPTAHAGRSPPARERARSTRSLRRQHYPSAGRGPAPCNATGGVAAPAQPSTDQRTSGDTSDLSIYGRARTSALMKDVVTGSTATTTAMTMQCACTGIKVHASGPSFYMKGFLYCYVVVIVLGVPIVTSFLALSAERIIVPVMNDQGE
ncbi:hypothetical protein BP00DRAFT_498175 [Aspergillus indologenus CBS 114.80]|uniref:Uncharacterized protein n=1 Tax=Aspergillus indologenus CBS 114.80 TaxID=1450541 RepID=A0A2V5IFH4_9EURO|nr:hypothetical protein BP00DRAFT_498175 [Aspergillus indologenus CBS 114.80]